MITACGAENRIVKRYSEWVLKARKYGEITSPLIALQFGMVFFAVYAAFALAFWYGARAFLEGRVESISTVVIVLMSVMMMVFSLERVATPLIDISKAMVAAAEFFAVIDAPRPQPGTLEEPDVSAKQDIVLSGVDFAYPSRPHFKVLDNLNLTIEAGKVTAIVGPSGSGKSTIVGLIERWYSLQNDQHIIEKTIQKDKMEEMEKKKIEKKKKAAAKKAAKQAKKEGKEVPEADDSSTNEPEEHGPAVALKGSITTCGHSLDEINVKWWRSQVGLVQQEPFLFNDTIFNNVAYGLVGSENQDVDEAKKKELVEEACKEAFADEFIDRLPDGYQTVVGDSGAKLSGGQRQRIAIARSIIKKPKILILDEATSAIDVRGERIVQAALDKVSKGRTTITIAHRLSTIKTADKICVMQKGRCVEEGTHDSLLANEEGAYYGLVNAQQLALGDDDGDESELQEESIGDILAREKSAAVSEAESSQEKKWKERGLIRSFGLLLAEQKSRMPYYILSIIFAAAASAAIPLQAYLFAKIINVFVLKGEELRRESEYWALMWLILAIGVGLSYLLLGYVSTHLQHYICATYRQEYFESILFQRTPFFDDEKHAAGALTACVAGDPKQLEQLLGMNMAMVYTAFFSIVGALIISFIYGWKLALVALCVTVPLGLGAGYYRIKYELEVSTAGAQMTPCMAASADKCPLV
jgi:ATP-binding cassette, subfamily B (MDR/TAP), member 1